MPVGEAGDLLEAEIDSGMEPAFFRIDGGDLVEAERASGMAETDLAFD